MKLREDHGWSTALTAALLSTLLVACGCSGQSEGDRPLPEPTPTPSEPLPDVFHDASEETRLVFNHFNGMTGELYLVEMMGPGVALFDFDRDGDLDVYIVQGEMFEPGKTFDEALFPPLEPLPLTDRLFRNDLQTSPDGRPQLRFTDVSREAGLIPSGYGQGVTAGDYDNDGWVDLYVTRFGPNQFLRNNGDGTFADLTRETGTTEDRWSVSAAFMDVDRDGWLDLYVGNYVELTTRNNRQCFNLRYDYCNPKVYNPVPDRLFRNRGDGTFEDVSVASRIAGDFGGALGVVTADFDADGWLDIYVANDGMANQCWMNRGDGSFENTALLAGCALNEMGDAEAGMGVDTGDFDNDGDEDLFLAHLATETNTLYVNDGQGIFEDGTRRADLAAASLPLTGFGASWLDFDNDGLLDVMVVNGAVTIIEELALVEDPYPLHQRNKLFRNLGGGRFTDWTARAGKVFERSEVSRGVAFGDLDNDGDTDVVVGNNSAPARLLLNDVGNRNHWVGLRTVAGTPPRDIVGTWVGVLGSDGQTLWRRAGSDGSYASSSDRRLLFGLGSASEVHLVRAHWPDGLVEEWEALPVDRWTTVARGTGRVVTESSPGAALLAEWAGRPEPATGAAPTPSLPGSELSADELERVAFGEALVPVELPELSELEQAVQEELTELHAAIAAARGRGDLEVARAYGELGMRCHAYSLWPTARTCYRNAHRLDPGAFRWPYYLGHALRSDGQSAAAAVAFRRAVAMRSDYVAAWVQLAELTLEAGRLDEAETLFRRALSFDPNCAPARVGLGRIADGRGDTQDAVEQFEAALALQPQATSVHYALAMAYRKLGDSRRARQHLELKGDRPAGAADPLLSDLYEDVKSALILISRGREMASVGQYERALEPLLEAVRREPDQANAHTILGAVMDALGRLDDAEHHYHRALDIDGNARARYGLGLVRSRRGADAEAVELFAEAVEADSALKQARLEWGKALERTGRSAEALAVYDGLLETDPLHAEAQLRAAFCLIRLGRHGAAAARLEQSVRAFPDEPAFAHVLARLLVASPDVGVRDGGRAFVLIQQLSQTLKDETFAETIAMAMAEVGRFDEAVAWERKAIDFTRRTGRTELLDPMRDRLSRYEDGLPCREPWSVDDAIFSPPPAPAS